MKKYFFEIKGYEKGREFKFCSELEKIGSQLDVAIINGTYVEVISEPILITTTKYGKINVVKVRKNNNEELWIPKRDLYEINLHFLN